MEENYKKNLKIFRPGANMKGKTVAEPSKSCLLYQKFLKLTLDIVGFVINSKKFM